MKRVLLNIVLMLVGGAFHFSIAQEPRTIKTQFAEIVDYIKQGDSFVATARRPTSLISYNENGKQTLRRYFDNAGKGITRARLFYDDAGRNIKVISLDDNGKQTGVSEIKYDTASPVRISETLMRDARGVVIECSVYYYDESLPDEPKVSRVEVINAKGEVVKRSFNTYNAETERYTWTHYDCNSKPVRIWTYRFAPGMNGNPFDYIETDAPSRVVMDGDKHKYTIEFYVKEVLVIKHETTMEYDSDGNITKAVHTKQLNNSPMPEPNFTVYYTYTYY